MRVIDLLQEGEDWLEWRRQGLSASDAPILMAKSPYKTRWRLWAEKTGFATAVDLSMNPLVRKGKENEDKARRLWEQKHNEMAIPLCVESEETHLIKASLDGLSLTGCPVETKCPSEAVWKEVLDQGEQSLAYQIYVCQVHQQIYVTGASHGYLVFFFEGQLKEFIVQRDEQFIFELMAEAKKFWYEVVENIEPAQDPQRDKYLPRGNDASSWVFAATQYREHQRKIDEARAEFERLKSLQEPHLDTFKRLQGEYRSGEYAGILFTQYTVEGSQRYRVTLTKELEPRNIADAKVLEPIKNANTKIAQGYF
ncbi:YqaJ viral recombinase family protein [Pseudovibrio sp. Ad37]|uniref:YqaJ viral recombinase family nuclease n=1 Tax=Pseudovibrio sp. Ad37 TaxID=989422 RepID=UPI0007AE6A05|nr:YqaJ viral recombinase family protein [Pseudovibrio sp. Ad37]KZL22670.1 YqaJ-like viral recombinase domain protein [Pseudovibrio sp. Ad37]